MRNKLQITTVTRHLFCSRGLKKFNSTRPRRSFQNKNFTFVFVFALALLFSGKSFAQISESFNSGIPGTWTIFNNAVGSSDWASTADGFGGTNGVSVNPSTDNIGDQNTAQYFLVTPQFAVPENGEIHFFTKQTSDVDNGAEYQIRISTAAQPDINGFNITIQSYTEANLNIGSQTAYEERVVELPPSIPVGLNIYIAFVAVNTQNGATPTGDEWFVDEVSILEGCIEIAESDVTIDAITVNGADVSWSHPTASNFEIQVHPAGGVPGGSGIPITETNYTLFNLDEDTEFDIYIRAICDNNTESAWTGPLTFETLKPGLSCDAPIIIPDISVAPYILADNLDNWANPDIVYSTQGTNCIPGSSTTNFLNGNKIFLSYTPTEDGLIALTQTVTAIAGGGDNNCFNTRSSLLVYESCDDVGVNCLAGVATISNDPKSISNLLVQAGQTYIIVVSTLYDSPTAGVCFSLEITGGACAPPDSFTYSNLTEDSVRFSWDNIGGFADSWEYVIVPTGSGEPTTSGTVSNTNTNVLVNGLTPNTTYDLYVRPVCSSEPGVWSSPYTFTTQCSVFSVPYFTDFETATNDNPEPCWTTIDVNNDGVVWNFLSGYATIYTGNTETINDDIYVSPQINFNDATPKRLRYKHRATNGTSIYSVKLSTTGVGIDDFTTTLLFEENITNSAFQEIIVDIPETITGLVNIAWIVEPNASETALRLSIDDVSIEYKPACPNPSNLGALNIQTNSAWLTWDEGDVETQWEVVIQDQDSGIPTGSGVLATSNFPYIASGLEPGHRYEYYVRADCEGDGYSEWIGPYLFITDCESYDTPFFESFNDEDPDTQKFCWSIVDQNSDEILWVMNENEPSLQSGGGPFTPTTDYDDYLISPAINIDGVKELKFKYRAQFSFGGNPRFGYEVLMSTTNANPASFTETISPLEIITNSAYQEKSIIINETGTIYIAFRVPPGFDVAGGASILNIDDVSITDASVCPNPTDLAVDTVSTNSADLSWAAGYQETAWNVVVQPAGLGVPTTTGIAVTTPSYSPTGLTPDTEYEFYVMANCGADGGSEWVGPITFRTLCTAFSTPFMESFNSDSDSEACWTIINDNNDPEIWELNTTTFPYEGDQAASMFTGTNGNNEDWLISPTITVSANQRLRYYYRVNNSFFTEDLEVLLSTNGTGLDQFTTVLYDSDDDPVVLNNEEYKVKIINLDGITGDINIAFHVPFFPSTGFSRGQTLVIDNVNIEDIPECPEPTNITVNNITDTAVQVAWDANGLETAWEISVQPSGTTAPVGDTDPNYLYNTTTNPFTVTGLAASTMYDVYVRAVCEGSTEGEWIGPIEVTTKCSFENLCEYTFILTSTFNSGELNITQNNQVTQSIDFNRTVAEEFTVLLCTGVEFSLFFHVPGSNSSQFVNHQFEIIDDQGATIFSSGTGMTVNTTVYTGTSICGAISCPQPTDLSVNETSVLSWTAGGSETQWEVAIQSIENGTIPQSGTIVSTNSYTPMATDFNDPNAATYEYFVRAICGTGDESYWSGPFAFVRNDDLSTALTLPINTNEDCMVSGTEVTFTGATVSAETMTCDGVNAGDVWFDFTAEALVHNIEINGFTGNFNPSSDDSPYPEITMTLYREDGTGGLEEVACSYDKVIVAMYASELIIGDTYKLRLTLNSPNVDEHKFKVCITTPEDLCSFNLAVNGDFETPTQPLGFVISDLQVVPGWRQNLDSNNSLVFWESLMAPGFEPYEGGQCVQLRPDQGDIDPNDPNIKGLYRDFDTSEITLFDYSYAHLARSDGNTMQVFAGPPEGPFTMINEHLGVTLAWTLVSGEYEVPDGQDVTRFIFRSAENGNGNTIDAVSFVANNAIITEDFEVDCNNPMAMVEAEGVGTWIASDANPGDVTFADANSGTTSISGFVQPGVYTFTWTTRYCENDIELTYNGIGDIPTVEALVEYCLSDIAQPLSATATGTYTLLWYAQATGGTGSVTSPTPDTSMVGNTSYYVAHTDGSCEGPRTEIVITINDAITPELTFSYASLCELGTANPSPILNDGFTTDGTFSSSTLTVDAVTGVVDMAVASGGMHDILYTYGGDANTCTVAGSYTATIDITAANTPEVTFDYGTIAFCLLEENSVTPILSTGFNTGGTFSSTTLTVNASTGTLDLTSAAMGIHDIVYTLIEDATNCISDGTYTTSIEVVETVMPVTTFTYSEDIFCADSASILPELETEFATGGTFSASSGLSIDATTGEINIASSSLGNYTITYEVLEDLVNCVEGSTSTFNITVLDTIEVAVDGDCNNGEYWLTALPLNNSFDANEATYTWTDATGNVVGQNSETFNVTEYANQNQNITELTQFTVTIGYGDCTSVASFTPERLSCKEIPRGISPDGNGKNDTFDLSGYGFTTVEIFNRNGRKVFSYIGNYTNQWHGQSNKDEELPDGTYFYRVIKSDWTSETGWVFINRNH